MLPTASKIRFGDLIQRLSIPLGIVLIGLALRLYKLGVPSSTWHDEDSTIGKLFHPSEALDFAIRAFTTQTIDPNTTAHPPLYHILISVWRELFGASIWSVRFVSVIFSVAVLILAYFLSVDIYDKKTATITTLILSISAYQINFAQTGRMYTMYMLFTTASFYALYKMISTDGSSATNYIFMSLVGIYTQYIFFLYLLTQSILYFVYSNLESRFSIRRWTKIQLVIAIFALPAIIDTVLTLLSSTGPSGWGAFHPTKVYRFLWFISLPTFNESGVLAKINGDLIVVTLWLAMLIALGLKSVLNIRFQFKLPTKNDVANKIYNIDADEWLLIFWAFLPMNVLVFGSLVGADIFVHRYVLPSTVPVVMLVSNGISNIERRRVQSAIVAIIVAVSAYNLLRYYEGMITLYSMTPFS